MAVAAWLALLTLCGLFLSQMESEQPDRTAIEAQLLEIPSGGPPTIAGASALSHSNPTTEPSPPKIATNKSKARAQAFKLNPNNEKARRANHAARRAEYLAHDDRHFDKPSASAIARAAVPARTAGQHGEPQSFAKTVKAAPSTTTTSEQTKGHPGSGNRIGAGGQDAKGPAGGRSARPIYAPLPNIPDDMRDEVMQATAIARFHIARDGSVTVSLIARTDFAELDQLILDDLSHWRFEPAVRDGVAVESNAEIRLRITVQ
ncbi:MAG TPA: energy transducer TonB [Candidatus Binataceae bacterium]|nr:energy transducer TonB [Candidatus Binataceae bacterium]